MRCSPVVLLAAITLAAAVPAPARSATRDQGSFKLYRHDRALGAETFEMLEFGDSLIVRARQYITIPTDQGAEPVERGADLLLNRVDFSVRAYQSNRTARGSTLSRGLAVYDTHYVAYREFDGKGEGESRVLPPGRLYVMDSQLITPFDLIARSLHHTSFANRPINLLALGPRDTMLDARAESLGQETIRWGGRPVSAWKLNVVADHQTTFTLWVSPQGQLLRLAEPLGGLRAEREPPPVKRRPPTPPKPKPGG